MTRADLDSPLLDGWLETVSDWFRDWGDNDWEKRFLASGYTHINEFGFDPFGMSPSFIKKTIPVVRFFYRAYFRVENHGLVDLPRGRVMFVANHSGQLPFDGVVIASAIALEGNPPRIVRAMVERWVPTLPFVSIFMARCGQVLGDPENSRRLLEMDNAILVFPEGVRGATKLYRHRYKLQEFGTGFMRLALETATPIVPVAVIGLEEAMPAFYNVKPLARLIKVPAFPLTPTFPWLLLLGLIPYPTKVHIYWGEPMLFSGDPNDEEKAIRKKVEQVKQVIDSMLKRGLRERRRIFF